MTRRGDPAVLTTHRSRFRYQAVDPDGRTVDGFIRAATRAQARQRLSVHQLIPTALDDAPGLLQTDVTAERLDHRRLEELVAQLAVFASSGVPLPGALLVIADETEHRLLRRTATDLAERLSTGQTLGDAVDAHAQVLPSHLRGVLRAADSTGELGTTLTGLHEHLQRQAVSRRRLVTALVYPGIVAVMSVVTMGVLALFALPRFATLFAELGADPPLITRVMASVGRQATTWWRALAAVTLLVTVAAVWALRSPRLRPRRDRLLWRLPMARTVMRLAMAERTCRVLALAASAGMPLPVALQLAIDVSHDTVVRDALRRAHGRIVQGDDVVAALDGTGLFPQTARQMIVVGERTGTLDRQLGVAAEWLAGELDRRLHRLTALLEPTLIVVVGVVVAGVAVSLVTSLYGVVEQIGA